MGNQENPRYKKMRQSQRSDATLKPTGPEAICRSLMAQKQGLEIAGNIHLTHPTPAFP